jgi:hypothetical protein
MAAEWRLKVLHQHRRRTVRKGVHALLQNHQVLGQLPTPTHRRLNRDQFGDDLAEARFDLLLNHFPDELKRGA